MTRYDSIEMFLINEKKNQIPVFIDTLPAILIFTNNSWEFPLIFSNSKDFSTLTDLIDKRKDLVMFSEDTQNLDDLENMFSGL